MRPTAVTDTDVALLRALRTKLSIVAAARAVGISRDRANYRIARLGSAFGGAVVAGRRGGREHGGTRLTPLGDRIARGRFDSVEMLEAQPVAPASVPNRIYGIYRAGAAPEVETPDGTRWRVSFAADDGERLSILLDPEAILLAPGRFASSARNLVEGTVEGVVRGGSGPNVRVRVRGTRVRAAVTRDAIDQLTLRPGRKVWLYVKATALRRAAPRRAARSRRRPVERRA